MASDSEKISDSEDTNFNSEAEMLMDIAEFPKLWRRGTGIKTEE